jgi:nitrate reductase beta subunit
MAATRPGSGATSELAASVGLTDDDLNGMYRVIATARAGDDRIVEQNPPGRIPVVI